MSKGLIWAAAAKLGMVGVFVGGLITGMQYKSEVNKTKNEFLGREYAEYSTRSPVELVDEENTKGLMEKRLKNTSTGEVLYTLAPDYLPRDSSFINTALCERVKSGPDRRELQQIYENTRELEKTIVEELYSSRPVSRESVNPSKIEVVARENDNGEVETVLRYGENSVVLSRKDVDNITRYGRHIVESEKKSESNSGYLVAGLSAIIAAAGAAVRKKFKPMG